MATINPPAPPPARSYRRRAAPWLALAVLAALAWYWRPLGAQAVTGTSYAARIACSCRFVAGRALDDCRKDVEPGLGPVTLREDSDARSVTARVPLLASQTATFREGEGCVLERWED